MKARLVVGENGDRGDLVVVQRVIGELVGAEYNPRKLSAEQRGQIEDSLKRFGFVDPIIVNTHPKRKNVIVGGHQRVKVAADLGYTHVPVVEVRLTEKQERELNIRLNKNTGEWDFEMLRENFDAVDLSAWGFTDEELSFLDVDDNSNNGDSDPPPDAPKDAVTKLGDIWTLGQHRLLCGDCTDFGNLDLLMQGEKASFCFTDPPYGVSYVGKTKDALTIENDAMPEKDLALFVSKAFDGVDYVLQGGGYVLATVPAGPLHLIFAKDWKDRGWLRQIMVWKKDSMVLGHSEYHYQHEPILFGWKEGGKRIKSSDRTKTTVWEFDRPKASKEHPTMKPVSMWVYGIKNHSRQGNLVFEPFGGSGTSLLACEKTGRICRCTELGPNYCDVIVQRWEELTGGKATVKHG